MDYTYAQLIADVQTYADRDDAVFVNQIPRLVDLAENRIASEVHGLGYLKSVVGAMTQGEPTLAKPARWRETISINYGLTDSASARRTFLRPRSYEYCRLYWPTPTVTGTPKYYADYDYEHFLIVATPAGNYPFELAYHERPVPLSDENQTNWTTTYAPQLLLYATLLEAQPFLVRPERSQEFQALYDRAKAGVEGEDVRRVTSKNAAKNS